jgi:flagellar assembly protein FliH
MPSSDSSGAPISGDRGIAYRRWELADFESEIRGAQPRAGERARAPEAAPEARMPIRLPTADELEQMHRQAHAEGYAAGYEEGTARVRMEALRAHTLIDNLSQALDAFDQRVADELVALAIELARGVVRRALHTTPEAILEVVREALAQLPHLHASIYLHPEDASLLRSYLGDQLAHAGHRILEEAQIARGGARVEAAGSQIDATLQTRWRRVLEAIGRDDVWMDTRKN